MTRGAARKLAHESSGSEDGNCVDEEEASLPHVPTVEAALPAAKAAVKPKFIRKSRRKDALDAFEYLQGLLPQDAVEFFSEYMGLPSLKGGKDFHSRSELNLSKENEVEKALVEDMFTSPGGTFVWRPRQMSQLTLLERTRLKRCMHAAMARCWAVVLFKLHLHGRTMTGGAKLSPSTGSVLASALWLGSTLTRRRPPLLHRGRTGPSS